ncbi:MAG TPA: acyltransferase [Puia sp.]|nr:acyltransferase [Puia sp.]
MLKKLLNYYISGLKGNEYRLDENIPNSYLLNLILGRIIMKCRGLICGFHHETIPFIGRHVTIKLKSKIRAGKNLSIGNRCFIDALSVEGIRLGDNVSIGRNTIIECTGNLQFLGKGLQVGNNVGMGTDNYYGCAGGIKLGDDTIVGNFVSFHAENHIFATTDIPIRLQGVQHQGITIGRDCWIGAKSTILDGVFLEDGCIIAAGAVVKSGIYAKNGIYAGVPAKLIKQRI